MLCALVILPVLCALCGFNCRFQAHSALLKALYISSYLIMISQKNKSNQFPRLHIKYPDFIGHPCFKSFFSPLFEKLFNSKAVRRCLRHIKMPDLFVCRCYQFPFQFFAAIKGPQEFLFVKELLHLLFLPRRAKNSSPAAPPTSTSPLSFLSICF